jgi:1,4-dihydroxy-2-naphthoate octaprenyltransferase
VDLDAKAGNRTIAVRIGAVAAYRLAVGLALLGSAVAATLALSIHGGWRGLILLAPSVATLAWAYPRAVSTFREPDRGRWQRIADMRATKLAELLRHASVVAVYTLPTAIALAAGLELMLVLGTWLYGARVVAGGLRRSLASA